jgi:mannose-6-phosphate isomerase
VVEETAPVERERLFDCGYFRLWRLRGQSPFAVGAAGAPRILVCLEGAGRVEHDGGSYAADKGDVLLLPAVVGACVFRPSGTVTLLEVALPE